MEKLKLFFGLNLLMVFVSIKSLAQAEHEAEENYFKKNMIVTNLRLLGVDKGNYTRCLESINFKDPDIKARVVRLEKEDFVDNGKGFDLVANDGILTSTRLYNYESGVAPIPPGTYQNLKESYALSDVLFEHSGTAKFPLPEISISCDLKWVKCSQWPIELQDICRSYSWPFNGGLQMTCKATIKWVLIGN